MLSREEVGQRLESPRGKATRQWERETLQTAQALYAERDELAAEGRVLKKALGVFGDLMTNTELIAAEVERVKRLEAVAEAFAEEWNDSPKCTCHEAYKSRNRDDPDCLYHKSPLLWDALAAWREEGG